MKKAASTTAAEPNQIDDAEARKVLQAVTDLEPKVKTATEKVVARKASFGIIKGQVSTNIGAIRNDTDCLSVALQAKSPERFKKEASDAKARIDSMFDAALAGLA